MPSVVALLASLLFTAYLDVRARKSCPLPSGAAWIAVIWITIVGTRPVSDWFGGGLEPDTPKDYLQGSPIDAYVYLALIAATLFVLARRKGAATSIVASNPWFVVFLLYCLLSVTWSHYPFVAFKRWFKDLGNVAIVLLLLSERDPLVALRGVFLRYIYLAVPLSVVFIKYFPDIGRYMDRWTWEFHFSGVTSEKNALGLVAAVSTIFLVWDLLERRAAHRQRVATASLGRRLSHSKAKDEAVADAPSTKRESPASSSTSAVETANGHTKLDWALDAILLLMSLWLLKQSDSSTAFACTVVGVAILLAPRYFSHLGLVALLVVVPAMLVYFALGHTFADILAQISEMLGRDETLTGRTDLWEDLLDAPINHVIGTGYQSFWLGWQAAALWEKYYFHPNQAHNGYLETWLNGGVIGVCILGVMIVLTWRKLSKDLSTGTLYACFRFSLFVLAVLSNWTEATFNRVSLTWILFIIASLDYRAWQVMKTSCATEASPVRRKRRSSRERVALP